MNYREYLLRTLLDRYERSAGFRKGDEGGRRRLLHPMKETALSQAMENIDEKKSFLSELDRLKEEGILDYSWLRYERGNLVESVWLLSGEKARERAYSLLDRTPLSSQLARLRINIEETLSAIEVEDRASGSPEESGAPSAREGRTGEAEQQLGIRGFLLDMLESIGKRQRLPRFFRRGERINGELLQALLFLYKNKTEETERVFSARNYGDSKYFEKILKAPLLSILREIDRNSPYEGQGDETLFENYGLCRWPEVLQFCGGISVWLEEEEPIRFYGECYGAYLNSETFRHIKRLELSGVERVLFIENLANYLWYLKKRSPSELVIWHGGFYSPLRGRWFRKIYEAGKRTGSAISYFHWSDIDLGGFRIFARLKRNIVPELKPYRMDTETLRSHRDRALPLCGESYRRKLEALLGDPEYRIFHSLIEEMLRSGLRLEQEQLL